MALRFKFLSSKTFLFFILLILVWFGIGVARVTYNRYQFNREIDKLKADIERTEKRNEELASLIEFFKTESFLEKEAREKLNLKKEGENVVVVPEASKTLQELLFPDSETKNPPVQKAGKEANVEKWWKYLFGE